MAHKDKIKTGLLAWQIPNSEVIHNSDIQTHSKTWYLLTYGCHVYNVYEDYSLSVSVDEILSESVILELQEGRLFQQIVLETVKN